MVTAALCAFALAAGASWFVFRHAASTSDELAQLWQAHILLSGRLSLPVDPNPEFFSLDTVVDSGRWYSQFPIGGPLFLVLGALIGAPWLVNPILLGISAPLLYAFGRRAIGEPQARIAVVLFVLSPMVALMAGTWMNHVPTMCLALVALVALTRWDAANEPRAFWMWSAVIGAALGAIAAIRPFDAVILSTVIGGFQLVTSRTQPRRLLTLVAQAMTGCVGVALVLWANSRTTGSALRFGYDVAWGPGHRVGFHVDPYGVPHTIAAALDYALSYIGELNMYLTAWPVPAVIALALGLVLMTRMTRWHALLLTLFGAQVIGYAAYWYRGEFLGPRFLYTVLPCLFILLAEIPFVVSERFGARPRRIAAFAMIACVAIALVGPSSTPGVAGLVAGARGQRQSLKADYQSAVKAANLHHGLVFVHEPFGSRLSRRLLGVGYSRPAVVQMMATRDACALLDLARRLEAGPNDRSKLGAEAASVPARADGAAVPRACQSELSADARYPSAPFGPALVDEPIGANGRIDGDVVYVADLGEHNEVLRSRFGDRIWVRMAIAEDHAGRGFAVIRPY